MTQGVLPYGVEVVDRADTVTGRAGLPLVIETLRALGLHAVIADQVQVRERASGYTETEKVEALILLLAAGGECLDDIAVLQADAGLGRLLGRRLPSADRLRHFLYACHDEALIAAAQAQRPPGTVAYLPAENAALQGLGHVNTALVHRVAAQGTGRKATLDHDATLQESHKREARPHYQGGRGYQPAAIYWVEPDLVVADEYRDGNVGAGMENLPLIQRGFASLPATVTEYAFRADSACYDERVLKWLADPARPGGPRGPIGFTVSADMTEPLHAVCAAVPEPAWALFEERPDETVHCTEVEFTPGDWRKEAWPLRYLVLRIRKKQGQLFATGLATKVPRGGEQPRGRGRRPHPLALAEGGDDRAGARRDQERARRRRPPLRALRGQRGLVPVEPPDLQRAQRPEVPGAAGLPECGPPQAAALRRVHPCGPARLPRGPAVGPRQRRGRAARRPDRRPRPARPHRAGGPRGLITSSPRLRSPSEPAISGQGPRLSFSGSCPSEECRGLRLRRLPRRVDPCVVVAQGGWRPSRPWGPDQVATARTLPPD